MTLTIHNSHAVHISNITCDNSLSTYGKLCQKVADLYARIKEFFAAKQTKAAAIISYWTLETVTTVIALTLSTNPLFSFVVIFLYLYSTYALLSAVNSLI